MKLGKGFAPVILVLSIVCCIKLGVVRGDDSTRSLLASSNYGGYHNHGYNHHHHHHGYGHWGRKLKELVATTRWATSTNTKGRETSSSDRALLATPIDAAPLATIQTNNKAQQIDEKDGKSRDLLGTQEWGSELIRHEDHFDRVPVWDATRSNGWDNHNHYSGGYGGHGHGRWLKSEEAQETKSEQQFDNTPQEITPTAGDKEDGKSRNLLGAQEWGSELIRHEDHFDRVPVWDATRSNGWENHNHYSGGYGGHGHGRWLKSETTQENKTEPQNDNTPQESTPAAGDKEEGGKSRNLLGTQEWGTELIRHEDHFDRVPVWDATRSNGWENHNHYSGGYGGRWLLSFFKIAHNKESKPQQGDKHQQGTPVAEDKEVGKSRSLLGTQAWGSRLVPHGDHFDRVPVWTPSHNHWDNHNHHHHNHGGRGRRWLLSKALPRSLLSTNHHHDEVVKVVVVETPRHHHHQCGLVSIGCWARKLMSTKA